MRHCRKQVASFRSEDAFLFWLSKMDSSATAEWNDVWAKASFISIHTKERIYVQPKSSSGTLTALISTRGQQIHLCSQKKNHGSVFSWATLPQISQRERAKSCDGNSSHREQVLEGLRNVVLLTFCQWSVQDKCPLKSISDAFPPKQHLQDLILPSLLTNSQPTLKGWTNEQLEVLCKDADGGNTHKTCQRLHFSSFCTESAAADAWSRKGNSSWGKEGLWNVPAMSRYSTFQTVSFEKEVTLFLGPSAPVTAGTVFVHRGCSIPQTGVQILAQHTQRWLPPAVTRPRCEEKMVLTD